MPLDVQPLSPVRRAIMLLAMVGLLGCSLGFAEYLVKRQKPTIRVTAQFPLPPGVKTLPVNGGMNEAFNGPIQTAEAQWGGGPRTFAAYSFDGNWSRPMPWPLCLQVIHSQFTDDAQVSEFARKTTLASKMAIESRFIVSGPGARFDILRMTIVENDNSPPHVVAFGFSGTGPFTDSDNRFFEDYCSKAIKITTESIQP